MEMSQTSKNWSKRDLIKEEEARIQELWRKKDVNHSLVLEDKPKFFVTFPYPYMNGTLHLGHGYTISKAEFMARYKKLQGYNVLFPFAFHGTGMPIVSCANKLKDELVDYEKKGVKLEDINSDEINSKSQTFILLKMGITREELPLFVDPYYWLKYFPERALDDLYHLGTCSDLKRSFVTTDLNPYYDKFIKWQFNILKKRNLLTFGRKPVVYSIKDGQACNGPDRRSGEEVGIKDYTVVKMEVVNSDPELYILVATTRPETFYVLANLWINFEGNYFEFIHKDSNKRYICSETSFVNLMYQDFGDIEKVRDLKGSELSGYKVKLPKYFNTEKEIGIFNSNVDMDKGTAIVGSVPSHSLFDFKNYAKIYESDLEDLRGVITVDENDNYAVDKMRNEKKSDPEKLNKEIFKMESTKGVMNIGKYLGKEQKEAILEIQKDLFELGDGFKYYETDGEAVSRTGDKCIVAFIDQWFINYGDETLTDRVNEYIENKLEVYNDALKQNYLISSEWIKEWACTRSVGLGTKFFDTEFVIDSLSDSTIYMSFYTVVNELKNFNIEELDDDFWNYLFLDGNIPERIDLKMIPTLEKMRNEFKYWYPLDLRVSGKDLIPNHLTMSLYNHTAVWGDKYMPKSYFANGYVMLNGEKMAKSTGNFMTIREAVDKYGADPTRIALAEAGSGFDDANFTESNADNAILKLTSEKEWCKELIDELKREGFKKDNKYDNFQNYEEFFDKVSCGELIECIKITTQYFETMDFFKALISGFYNFISVKDKYVSLYKSGLIEKNNNLMYTFLENHLIMLYPFCPHYVEDVWNYGESKGINFSKKWATVPEQNLLGKYIFYNDNMNQILTKIRTGISNYKKLMNKKGKEQEEFTVNIEIYPEYSTEEKNTIVKIRDAFVSGLIWKDIASKLGVECKDKNERAFCGKLVTLCKNNYEKYGMDWFDWIQNPENHEYDILNRWLHKILNMDFSVKNVEISIGSKRSNKTGPWNPFFKIC